MEKLLERKIHSKNKIFKTAAVTQFVD